MTDPAIDLSPSPGDESPGCLCGCLCGWWCGWQLLLVPFARSVLTLVAVGAGDVGRQLLGVLATARLSEPAWGLSAQGVETLVGWGVLNSVTLAALGAAELAIVLALGRAERARRRGAHEATWGRPAPPLPWCAVSVRDALRANFD